MSPVPNALSVPAILTYSVGHFLVIIRFGISQGDVWTPRGLCWLAEWLSSWGCVANRSALIKGGPKHQLKSTGPHLRGGRGLAGAIFPLHYMFGESVCVCASVWLCWSVMTYWATALLYTRSVRVTLNYCFPNTRQSMSNGYDSVHDEWIHKSLVKTERDV